MPDKNQKTYSLITVLLIVCIIALLAVIGLLLNRMNTVAPQGPPLPGPPVEAPPPAELKTVRGIVKGYQHNVHLDINGIQLQKEGDGVLTFEFRPHTANAILSVAKTGDWVEIAYNTQPNDEEIVYRLHEIKQLHSGNRVNVDQLPPPPRIPPGQQAQLFQTQNPTVITDGYGGIAALQTTGKLFHFKPEQVEDIQSIIKNGHNFSLLAVKRSDDQGFINIHHDQVYIVISVTIDNKTFMIR